jgi:hypothetical protein
VFASSRREQAGLEQSLLSIAVPETIADGLELLATDGLLTVSDHARQALKLYLMQAGALAAPMTAPANGTHEKASASGQSTMSR